MYLTLHFKTNLWNWWTPSLNLDVFPLIFSPFNFHHLGSHSPHPLRGFLNHHLRNVSELPLDCGLKALLVYLESLYTESFRYLQRKLLQEFVSGDERNPTVSPPCSDGNHTVLGDIVSPIHQHYGGLEILWWTICSHWGQHMTLVVDMEPYS